MSDKHGAPQRISGVLVSNPDKVWFPDDGITKGDVARFYESVAPLLLPWVKDRPLTAERCPDGMAGGCFYQKDFKEGQLPELPKVAIFAESRKRTVNYLLGGSKKTLIGMANLGCIAIHTMNWRRDQPDRPDWLAFDMDPTTGSFADAARAGLLLRGILDELKVRSYAKTSGSRGLHIFVPLRRGPTNDEARAFAFAVDAELAKRAPELVTNEHRKAARGAPVFADALRNGYSQTIVAPYSVRRRPKAAVSTPLAWDEVEERLDPSTFNVRTLDRRLAGTDPWADFWQHRQKLPAFG